MDNNLTDFGNAAYQPELPINCVYDTWGVPAAMIRGLFEYLYRADGLRSCRTFPGDHTAGTAFSHPVRQRASIWPRPAGPITGVRSTASRGRLSQHNRCNCPTIKCPAKRLCRLLWAMRSRRLSGQRNRTSPRTGGTRHGFASAESGRGGRRRDEQSAAANRRRQQRREPLLGADRTRQGCSAGRCRQDIAALAAGNAIDDVSLVGDWTPVETVETISFPTARGKHLSAKIVGELPLTDSTHGKAAHFTGKGYLEIAHDPRLNLTKALTLDAWIRPAVLPGGGGRIIDKSEVGTSNGFLLDTHPGPARLIVDAGAASYEAKFQPDKWVHVAATVAPDGKIAMYVDGKPVASDSGHQTRSRTWGSCPLESLPCTTFHKRLVAAGLAESYEAAHARLAAECMAVACAEEIDGRGPVATSARSFADRCRPLVSGNRQPAVRRPGKGPAVLCQG